MLEENVKNKLLRVVRDPVGCVDWLKLVLWCK